MGFLQKIPAFQAVDVSVTSYGTQILLAITHHERSVSVYRFALDLGFLLLENIPIPHCQSANFMELKDESYLIITTDSQLPDGLKLLKLNAIGVKADDLDAIGEC